MTDSPQCDIKRLKDGSIDYTYYETQGSLARHRAVKSLITTIPRLTPNTATIGSLIGLAIILPILNW